MNYTTFNKLIRDQFEYGGKKYAKTSKKEATDVLFERHTHRWLVGTIDKYTFRYANLERERDLLKIATYMYILWLKRGYHLSVKGTMIVNNTTVKVKSKCFDMFLSQLSKVKLNGNLIRFISRMMRKWSYQAFYTISERDIHKVYYACYLEWERKFSKTAGQDTDTWNELKKQLQTK